MKHILIVLVLILPLSCINQEFSFVQENVTMKITNDRFCVTGFYQINGKNQNKNVLVYPFPIDSLYGDIDSLKIYNLSTNELITPLSCNNKKAVFKINFDKNKVLDVQISYCQKLLGHQAEYLLKSTISRERPLIQANFQLIVPDNITITHFSYLPQDSIKTDSELVYYWRKINFMPKDNMIFKFK
jgi:hypothetical protein